MEFKFTSVVGASPGQKNPPSVEKIIKACKALQNGDLLDRMAISSASKLSPETVNNVSSYAAIKKFRHIVSKKSWYGNEATIIELKKKFP
jgi:hypothetical protein